MANSSAYFNDGRGSKEKLAETVDMSCWNHVGRSPGFFWIRYGYTRNGGADILDFLFTKDTRNQLHIFVISP